jgi:PAS domain S-box-containing protein
MPPDVSVATAATVLVVEDDAGIADLERSRLEESGYRVLVAETAEDALRVIGREGIDLVLLDYRLPGEVNGLDFYDRVRAAGYDLPAILVTGDGNEATVIRALRIGVRDFVTKSLAYLDYLPEAVARTLRQVGTERRLAESEARLARVIGSAKDAVIVVEDDGTISLFNPAAEVIFGCPAARAIGRRVSDFIPDEPGPDSDAADDPAAAWTHRLRAGRHGVRANGEAFPLEATVARGEAAGRRFHTVVARDITARRAAEDALRLRDRAIRAVEQGIVITDANRPDHPIVYASPGFERMTGYPSDAAIGRNCRFLQGRDTDPDPVARIRAAVGRGEACTAVLLNYRRDGTPFWNELSLSPIREEDGRLGYFVGVQTDVTERRRLEEQLRQSQKMEAIGQLAGGVAHDFNNLLTVINGYSSLLMRDVPTDEPAREMLAEIRKAGERSAGLTRQLLAFSRQQVVVPRLLDLNEVIAGTAAMLRRLIGEDVRLGTVPFPDLWAVRADPGMIEQVLLNLAVNARDAMPRGGSLTVATRNVELDGEYARVRPEARPGPHVLLSVSDTGVGMTDDVKGRIFEPFFTTKGPGKGTGLGLATVFGIVKQSGGHIGVESAVGVGTTFRVYFPRAEGAAGPHEEHPAPVPAAGAETVLLVEDESAVRCLVRHVLASHGYTVLEASDGGEAGQIESAYRGPIHLLVTDVVMPGEGGRSVAERIAASRPGVRVLFISGYTNDAVVRHGILHESVDFLQKPFTPAALAHKVREVLDR